MPAPAAAAAAATAAGCRLSLVGQAIEARPVLSEVQQEIAARTPAVRWVGAWAGGWVVRGC